MTISISELYHGEYLNALDIATRGDLKVRIIAARLVDVYNQEKRETVAKVALSLQGLPRLMVVNTTNARIIAQALGDDAEKWVGGALTIYAGKAKGKDSIIVKQAWRPAPAAKQAQPTPKAAPAVDTETGEIATPPQAAQPGHLPHWEDSAREMEERDEMRKAERMVATFDELKARTPVAKCAILTGQWAAALGDLIAYYGNANHAVNAAAKLGHAEITDANVVIVAAELRVWAEGRAAEKDAAQAQAAQA